MRSERGWILRPLIPASFFLLTILAFPSERSLIHKQEEVRLHYSTDWKIEPSFKFDALCFLNILTGDPFYMDFYPETYDEFKPDLNKPVKRALANLKSKIKDEAKLIISAFLCLYFSATDDETLDDMLKTLDSPRMIYQNLRKSPYYSEAGWMLFLSVQKDLRVIFRFLKEIQFDIYWEKHVLPKTADKILFLRKEVHKYNIIEEVEFYLGTELSSRRLEMYILFFSKPHALKILGTRYLTNVDWPLEITLRTAVHELMHPPFVLSENEPLQQALFRLREDPFLMDKVLHHNPSYGYNTFEGFVEEDCVQALEQMINEKMNIALEPRRRWAEMDEGMHVLAVALFSLFKKEKFVEGREAFSQFLLRMIQTGRLVPGKIKALFDEFYQEKN